MAYKASHDWLCSRLVDLSYGGTELKASGTTSFFWGWTLTLGSGDHAFPRGVGRRLLDLACEHPSMFDGELVTEEFFFTSQRWKIKQCG
uniref:Uncharacterized protein n=1 Tax=Brassica oleracea TaxID=3712 RepID=A0A3P6DFP8_BRAOL|nr:unnamed protein product [Brassica oleracea]